MSSSQSTRRLGFVDHRLDNFHADVYLKMLRGPLAGRGYELVGATAWMPEPSREWCRQNDVPYFDSVEQLNEHVDFFAILAPANPELHLEMCRAVLPFGKATFVDKTFAPDGRTAEQIFALADQYGVTVQTTSALRTTHVQACVRTLNARIESMVVWAGGMSWEEYGIHPVELVISCLGPGVAGVLRTGSVDHPVLVLAFEDGRTAMIDFNPSTHVPFQAAVTTHEGTQFVTVDDRRLFEDACSAILDFFDAGRALVDRAESLAVRRILDVAMSDAADGSFCSIHRDLND